MSGAAALDGQLALRADSGFFSYALIDTLVRLRVRYSITIQITARVQRFIDVRSPTTREWQPITYPGRWSGLRRRGPSDDLPAPRQRAQNCVRLVVRRTRLTDRRQQRLWPNWRHHCFVTNVDLSSVEADAFHRDHARVELAIRDLKEGAGLEHCPSGRFFANAAWLGCAVLAHDLVRWTVRLGGDFGSGERAHRQPAPSGPASLPLPWSAREPVRPPRPPLCPERWPWATTFTIAPPRTHPVVAARHVNRTTAVRRSRR